MCCQAAVRVGAALVVWGKMSQVSLPCTPPSQRADQGQVGTQTHWDPGRAGLESGAPRSLPCPSSSVRTAAEAPGSSGPGLGPLASGAGGSPAPGERDGLEGRRRPRGLPCPQPVALAGVGGRQPFQAPSAVPTEPPLPSRACLPQWCRWSPGRSCTSLIKLPPSFTVKGISSTAPGSWSSWRPTTSASSTRPPRLTSSRPGASAAGQVRARGTGRPLSRACGPWGLRGPRLALPRDRARAPPLLCQRLVLGAPARQLSEAKDRKLLVQAKRRKGVSS